MRQLLYLLSLGAIPFFAGYFRDKIRLHTPIYRGLIEGPSPTVESSSVTMQDPPVPTPGLLPTPLPTFPVAPRTQWISRVLHQARNAMFIFSPTTHCQADVTHRQCKGSPSEVFTMPKVHHMLYRNPTWTLLLALVISIVVGGSIALLSWLKRRQHDPVTSLPFNRRQRRTAARNGIDVLRHGVQRTAWDALQLFEQWAITTGVLDQYMIPPVRYIGMAIHLRARRLFRTGTREGSGFFADPLPVELRGDHDPDLKHPVSPEALNQLRSEWMGVVRGASSQLQNEIIGASHRTASPDQDQLISQRKDLERQLILTPDVSPRKRHRTVTLDAELGISRHGGIDVETERIEELESKLLQSKFEVEEARRAQIQAQDEAESWRRVCESIRFAPTVQPYVEDIPPSQHSYTGIPPVVAQPHVNHIPPLAKAHVDPSLPLPNPREPVILTPVHVVEHQVETPALVASDTAAERRRSQREFSELVRKLRTEDQAAKGTAESKPRKRGSTPSQAVLSNRPVASQPSEPSTPSRGRALHRKVDTEKSRNASEAATEAVPIIVVTGQVDADSSPREDVKVKIAASSYKSPVRGTFDDLLGEGQWEWPDSSMMSLSPSTSTESHPSPVSRENWFVVQNHLNAGISKSGSVSRVESEELIALSADRPENAGETRSDPKQAISTNPSKVSQAESMSQESSFGQISMKDSFKSVPGKHAKDLASSTGLSDPTEKIRHAPSVLTDLSTHRSSLDNFESPPNDLQVPILPESTIPRSDSTEPFKILDRNISMHARKSAESNAAKTPRPRRGQFARPRPIRHEPTPSPPNQLRGGSYDRTFSHQSPEALFDFNMAKNAQQNLGSLDILWSGHRESPSKIHLELTSTPSLKDSEAQSGISNARM